MTKIKDEIEVELLIGLMRAHENPERQSSAQLSRERICATLRVFSDSIGEDVAASADSLLSRDRAKPVQD